MFWTISTHNLFLLSIILKVGAFPTIVQSGSISTGISCPDDSKLVGTPVHVEESDVSIEIVHETITGRTTELQTTIHFSCPHHGDDLEQVFTWRVKYDPFHGEALYIRGKNVDYFDQRQKTGWNPLNFSAVWHRQMFGEIHSKRSQCYYQFWQHFYGYATPNHLIVIAPTDIGRNAKMRPGVEETCVAMGKIPNAESPTTSCTIERVVTKVLSSS